MKIKPGKAIAIVGLVILFQVIFVILTMEYSIRLPHGYKIRELTKGIPVLVNPQRNMMIETESYRICNDLLVGRRSLEEDQSLADPHRPLYDYLIVNMKSGQLNHGLNRADWLRELKRYGFKEPPVLRPPSRFDRFFRAKELRGE